MCIRDRINRPNTIADLEQCSIHLSNVWYSDQNRHAMKPAETNRNELRPLVPDVTTPHERQVFSRPHNVRKSGKLSVTPVSYTHLDVYKRQKLLIQNYSFILLNITLTTIQINIYIYKNKIINSSLNYIFFFLT